MVEQIGELSCSECSGRCRKLSSMDARTLNIASGLSAIHQEVDIVRVLILGLVKERS